MVVWESMSRGTGSFLVIFTARRMHAYAQYVLWPGAGRSFTAISETAELIDLAFNCRGYTSVYHSAMLYNGICEDKD